ncbi:UNKNOWN [Stylonychia lemnae]|uniref:Cyclic nucleotide-binding domain-containing protein n=1 Tax=Stylonychia lemnae TaxID=5949 RepID=A0A078AE00_STYLE|nr:UNKNOWN [Stylonychia lemnae]|eukprot:CDW80454.1 UNKNOWN [Stylonychia lemnae]
MIYGGSAQPNQEPLQNNFIQIPQQNSLSGIQQLQASQILAQNQVNTQNMSQGQTAILFCQQFHATLNSDNQPSQQPDAIIYFSTAVELSLNTNKQHDESKQSASSKGSSQNTPKLQKANTRRDTVPAQNNVSLIKRLQYQEKGKMNSQMIGTDSKLKSSMNANQAPQTPSNQETIDQFSMADPLKGILSRRSSFGDNQNSTRSLNNTQANFNQDFNLNSYFGTSEVDQTRDIFKSIVGPEGSLAEQKTLKKSSSELIQNHEEFFIEEEYDYTENLGELTLTMIQQNRDSRKFCKMIYPDSTLKTVWDMLGMVMIFYQAIMIPYRLSFGDTADGALAIIEYIMDVYFIFDLGYYKQGNLIMNRRLIITNYLQTWFVLDLLASFPYTWIIDNADKDDNADEDSPNYSQTNLKAPQLLRLIRIIRFMRVLKLLRLLKLKNLVYKEFFLNDSVNLIIDFAKLFVIVFFIIHWVGCFFFAIANFEASFHSDNWLRLANLNDMSDFDSLYITSIYWAFLTMATIGYGDIYPVSVIEKIYVMFCMIGACAVFAYLVGYIGSVLEKSETIIQEFKQYKLEEEEVLDMLSESLRLELIIHMNGKMLHNTMLFRNFDIQFLSELTFVLKKETLSDDFKLFDEGDKGQNLYFIIRGSIIIAHKKTFTYIKELGTDEYLGEIAFFSDFTRKATARSKNFAEVLILDIKDFLTQAQNYPAVHKNYLNIKKSIQEDPKNLKLLGITCYLCEGNGHIAIDCNIFPTIQGNLKVHAYEKLKKIQKLLTQQSKRGIKRARHQISMKKHVENIGDPEDSIITEECDENDDIEQIREATNEDDEEELQEEDDDEDEEEEQKKRDKENHTTPEKGLSHHLTKILRNTQLSKLEVGIQNKLARISSVSSQFDHIKRENTLQQKLQKGILKQLTFQKKNLKSKSPPSNHRINGIQQIDEENLGSDESSQQTTQQQQQNRAKFRESIQQSLTMKQLNRIMTRVKINTESNQKVQKNSMVARGIKLALREINKEIKKTVVQSPQSPLQLPSQLSTNKSEPIKSQLTALEALSKKFQLVSTKSQTQFQSQEHKSNTKISKDIGMKMRNLSKLGTFKDKSIGNFRNSLPKNPQTNSGIGSFSSITQMIGNNFQSKLRGGSQSHHAQGSIGATLSKLQFGPKVGNLSNQGTMHELDKISQMDERKSMKRFPVINDKSDRQNKQNVKDRKKSAFINGAVPIPDDLNLNMLNEIFGNISESDSDSESGSIKQSGTSFESSSSGEQFDDDEEDRKEEEKQ